MTAPGGAGSAGSAGRRHGLARDVAALLAIAAACPGAMAGGALLNCASEEVFNAECAMEGITFSPFLLIGAGFIAGLLTRGWRGFAFVFAGMVLGMSAILVMSALAGNLVLIGPIEGIIATIWFGVPVTLGYGIGRVVGRVVGGAFA